MKTSKKLLSVLLALVLALSCASLAFAEETDPWALVPTSPEGLHKGDLYLNFAYLYAGREDLTEDQIAAALEIYNSADWYIDFDAKRVKVVSENEELNGDQGANQSMVWIHCVREVGVEWVNVKQNMFGLQVGDYYLDKDVYYQVAAEKTYPKLISVWEKDYGKSIDELSEEERADVLAMIEQASASAGDMYWNRGFLYNPGGNLCVWCVANMPASIIFPFADSYVMIAAQAAQAALRQADAATVAASPWVSVASSIEEAEEGGYYLDLSDTAALTAGLGMTQAPSDEELAMIRNGKWYADFNRSVVAGTLTIEDETGTEEYEQVGAMFGFAYPYEMFTTMDYPESAELFALLKVKPVTQTEPTTEPTTEPATEPTTQPTQPENPQPSGGSSNPFAAIANAVKAFFNTIANFFKHLFR